MKNYKKSVRGRTISLFFQLPGIVILVFLVGCGTNRGSCNSWDPVYNRCVSYDPTYEQTTERLEKQREIRDRGDMKRRQEEFEAERLAAKANNEALATKQRAAEEKQRATADLLLFMSNYFAAAIKPQFDDAGEFHDGLAKVKTGGNWGYIDGSGELVIQPKFLAVEDFSEGMAVVNYDYRYGYIDKSGKFVFEIAPQFEEADNVTGGLARLKIGGLWGYYDKTGNMVIKPQFRAAGKFLEDLALVNLDGKWGYIDKSGHYVIKPLFDDAGGFHDGLARVKTGGKWGYIDNSGKFVIQPKFLEVEDFSDGMAVVNLDYKYGYIDKSGKFVFEIGSQFEEADNVTGGLARLKTGGMWGYFDRTGDAVIKPQFKTAGKFSEGLAVVNLDGKWGYIDEAGEFVIKPQFDNALHFSEGLARVKIGGKWGYVEKTSAVASQSKGDDSKDVQGGSEKVNENQWSKERFVELFPQPTAGWSASEIEISEKKTFAQKSGLEGIFNMSAALLGNGQQTTGVRYVVARDYHQDDKTISMEIDTESIDAAAAITSSHGYSGHEEGKLVPLVEADLPNHEKLNEAGVQLCEIEKHLCLDVSKDDTFTRIILIDQFGAFGFFCAYDGCREDVNLLTETSDLDLLDKFARFDHQKVINGSDTIDK